MYMYVQSCRLCTCLCSVVVTLYYTLHFMFSPSAMAHEDVDVRPFSSVPATVNHREAQPETEPVNSEATKGR